MTTEQTMRAMTAVISVLAMTALCCGLRAWRLNDFRESECRAGRHAVILNYDREYVKCRHCGEFVGCVVYDEQKNDISGDQQRANRQRWKGAAFALDPPEPLAETTDQMMRELARQR